MCDHEEARLIEGLRAGDEDAFMALVEMYHNALLRLALLYVRSRPLAEDVVQETWVGVIKGMAGFQGRSSLKSWLFTILVNSALKPPAPSRPSGRSTTCSTSAPAPKSC